MAAWLPEWAQDNFLLGFACGIFASFALLALWEWGAIGLRWFKRRRARLAATKAKPSRSTPADRRPATPAPAPLPPDRPAAEPATGPMQGTATQAMPAVKPSMFTTPPPPKPQLYRTPEQIGGYMSSGEPITEMPKVSPGPGPGGIRQGGYSGSTPADKMPPPATTGWDGTERRGRHSDPDNGRRRRRDDPHEKYDHPQ